MEDHKVGDSAAADAFQKGEQTFAVEVDAGGDVTDDIDTGAEGKDEVDLSLQVGLLVIGGDTGVSDGEAADKRSDRDLRGRVVSVFFTVGPGSNGISVDMIGFLDSSSGNKGQVGSERLNKK